MNNTQTRACSKGETKKGGRKWKHGNLYMLRGERAVQDAGFPEINIICEKVAAEGITRFEDRYKLPVGISVNMTSWSAKMMTHVSPCLAGS
jgi:hypothetical protein